MTSANHDRANTSWRRIADQSIWGPRGPVKTIHLWLPLAVVFIDTATEELKPAALLSLRLLLAAVCFVLVTILTNDLCDRREDASSAKERWIVSMPRPAGLAIVGVMACLGLLVLLPISGNAGGAVAYIAALGLGTLYSVRPVRLKGRGAWGPLTYGLSTALAFAAMPWARHSFNAKAPLHEPADRSACTGSPGTKHALSLS